MSLRFRNNCDILGYAKDYHKIRKFLLELNFPSFLFGKWDFMVSHYQLQKTALPKIGLWEDDGNIVALATFDTWLGKSFFCVLDEYCHLKKEMLLYSKDSFAESGKYKALISDSDVYFQNIADKLGFVPTQEKESGSIFHINSRPLTYSLPDGYKIVSLRDNYDIYKYGQVMWRGFNHEADGEGVYNPAKEYLTALEDEMVRPNSNLDLKIAVVAPNGNFVSFCGMWYDEDCEYAVIEPLATDPDFRKLGLGKAVAFEGIKRCAQLGAKYAFVYASQQFYYNIGFRPYESSTWWEAK